MYHASVFEKVAQVDIGCLASMTLAGYHTQKLIDKGDS